MKFVVFTILLVMLLQDETGGLRFRFRRRRRRRGCPIVNCVVNGWSSWSQCNHACGSVGTQHRHRSKSVVERCGGRCSFHLHEARACNRFCKNGGKPLPGRCLCPSGWWGQCCEKDINECQEKFTCQHNCINIPGSFVCSCQSCFTAVGNRCYLKQCKIDGDCHMYGTANPKNECQECQMMNKYGWTNNDTLPCDDGDLCTKNDHCENGTCTSTPLTCLPCETCDGQDCKTRTGFCVIDGQCYQNGDISQTNQCQECKMKNKRGWTNNDELPCDDGDLCTKNDHCVNGTCTSTPFTCLPCETCNGSSCTTKASFCVIDGQCYQNGDVRQTNPCQMCNTEISTTDWTNKSGSCDDGDNCTNSDSCQNGECKGITFSCDSKCEYCNGDNCSRRSGDGCIDKPVSIKCTEKVSNSHPYLAFCPKGTRALVCYGERGCYGAFVVGRRICRSFVCYGHYSKTRALCCNIPIV